MNKQNTNTALLFFLNAILSTVLDTLEGGFIKTAKLNFKRVVQLVNKLDRSMQEGLKYSAEKNGNRLATDTYQEASKSIAEILNISMKAYNSEKLEEFTEYCKAFK